MAFFDQDGFDARFEWGPEGARRLARVSDVIVVVDVLRFTTTVTEACARGASVYPYRVRDESAGPYARELGAFLMATGDRTPEQPYSLSPSSVRSVPTGARLVYPTPNGAMVSLAASGSRATVLAGCLRNASAVARAARALGGTVTVIACGERWGDELRPCLEDLLGAGAILSSLAGGRPSPEARAAIATFEGARGDLTGTLVTCSSGRELREKGCEQDILFAAELDASDVVPVLRDGAFQR